MRRYPVGVAVATVEVEGTRLGLTLSSLVPLALEPPLVGISIGRQAAFHELLREAGGFAVSLLAGDQLELAQHFARGVPPIAMWQGVAVREGDRGPLLDGAVGWLECELGGELEAGDHTLFLGRVERVEPGADKPPLLRLGGDYRLRMIDAVVFDMDGVIVDSEQVWDDVREQLAKERGGRWHDGAQAAMMGMSSPEWSAYMHDEIGLSESPEEINAEVVERMLDRYRERLPLIDGAVEAVRRLAAEFRLGVASSSNRPLIETVLERAGIAELFDARRLLGGGRARQAGAGRLPRGDAPARRRPRAHGRRRGLRERDPRRARGGDARDRAPERALPAGRGRAGARRRSGRVAGRADAGARPRVDGRLEVDAEDLEDAAPRGRLPIAKVATAHPLIEADRVWLGLPLEPRRAELRRSLARSLEEHLPDPAADPLRLDPEVVEHASGALRHQRRPADRAPVLLGDEDLLRRERRRIELAGGVPAVEERLLVTPVPLRRQRDLTQSRRVRGRRRPQGDAHR